MLLEPGLWVQEKFNHMIVTWKYSMHVSASEASACVCQKKKLLELFSRLDEECFSRKTVDGHVMLFEDTKGDVSLTQFDCMVVVIWS